MEEDRFGLVEPLGNGLLKITGRTPSQDILDQLQHRIGPNEAAIEISAEVLREYMRSTEERSDTAVPTAETPA